MKRRALIAIAISLALLAIFVTLVGWQDVLESIERATLSIYAIAFVGSTLTLALRAGVWSRVLAVVDTPRPYWLVASVFATATFVKYVTPYGQVTSGVGNAAIINRYTDAAYEESLAAVVSADVLTYLPYYTFGLVGAVVIVGQRGLPFDPAPFVGPSLLTVAVLVVALVAVWRFSSAIRAGFVRAVLLLRSVVARISPRLGRRLTRENVEDRLEGFAVTLELVSTHRRPMLVALVYSHLGWLGLATALYASAHAVGATLPITVVFLVVALSKLGFVVPTPGGIGGVEATLAAAIYLFAPGDLGMTVATATGIAILYRFATYWFTIAVGGTTSLALTIKDPLPPSDRA